jgi:hypothetical protein
VLALRARAGAGLTSPLNYCEPPRAVHRPELPPLLHPAALDKLRRERLVVIDDVVSPDVINRAAAELAGMQQQGFLVCPIDDLCAPRTQRHNLLLRGGTLGEAQRAAVPALAQCVEALCNVPELLERELGLGLRVPQTVMVTAMPPGAAYREHLDGNGTDNPRLVTVLLYLSYDPPRGGALRVKMADGPRDIYPNPGRAVVFMAQELKHEVLASEGERLAMTLWIWQTAPDGIGR